MTMLPTRRLSVFATLLMALCVLPAVPAAALAVGDPAPPLVQGDYVQGEAVTELEEGTVYIVEFWATWCGPCVTAIPHVNELQEKYADQGVVVIGQNVWEDDEAAVRKFVAEMGDKMTYRVAFDKDGQMAATWMEAAGQGGIPAAFIVDRTGTVAWIGHPMSMDQPLAQIVEGTYDPAAAAEQEAALNEIGEKINAAMQAGNLDDALALMDEAAELVPEAMKVQVQMGKFQVLAEAERMDEAYEVLRPAIEASDDADMLNSVAWMLVSPDSPIAEPDLDLASAAATKSNELSDHEDPDYLDTLARVQFLQGDADQAAATQKTAIEKAEAMDADEGMLEYLKASLAEYEAGA